MAMDYEGDGTQYRVKLTRVTNGSALRTDAVEGYTYNLPRDGHPFAMIGEALTEGAVARLVTTSPVKEVLGTFGEVDATPMMFLFETENSTYRLDVMEEPMSELDSGQLPS